MINLIAPSYFQFDIHFMKKIIKAFFYILAFIFGFNALYIFFFTSNSDYFRVFGMIETNKLVAGMIYLGFSLILLIVLKFEKDD